MIFLIIVFGADDIKILTSHSLSWHEMVLDECNTSTPTFSGCKKIGNERGHVHEDRSEATPSLHFDRTLNA